jgi:hypothetical protein
VPAVYSRSVGTTEDRHNCGDNAAKRSRLQYTCYALHQIAARREEFPGPRITRDLKRTLLKIRSLQNNRGTVGVRLAGHLAQNPVAAPGVGKHHGRTEFGLR